MHEILADTYNLSAGEREILGRLGVAAWDEDAGTACWAARAAGGDNIGIVHELLDSLSTDHEGLCSFGMWYKTGKCQNPVVNPPDVLQCPPSPRGCRRTMGLGNFPFWPIEDRCCDCIRDSVHGPSEKLDRQVSAGKKLRQLLQMTGSANVAVPHLTEVIGSLVVLQGGVNGVVQKWNDAIEAVRESKPAVALGQYKALAEMIKHCNEMQSNELSILDNLDDEQLRDYIVQLLMQRLTQEQIKMLLEGANSLSQSDIGRLQYG